MFSPEITSTNTSGRSCTFTRNITKYIFLRLQNINPEYNCIVVEIWIETPQLAAAGCWTVAGYLDPIKQGANYQLTFIQISYIQENHSKIHEIQVQHSGVCVGYIYDM